MKFEVIECSGEWIVLNEGAELARFEEQAKALDHIAILLRDAEPGSDAVSLRVRFQAPG